MNGSTKELRDKRKQKLFDELRSIRQRSHEVSLCLQRPTVLSKKDYDEYVSEHNALLIRTGNLERCLYAEFGMNDSEIDKELQPPQINKKQNNRLRKNNKLT